MMDSDTMATLSVFELERAGACYSDLTKFVRTFPEEAVFGVPITRANLVKAWEARLPLDWLQNVEDLWDVGPGVMDEAVTEVWDKHEGEYELVQQAYETLRSRLLSDPLTREPLAEGELLTQLANVLDRVRTQVYRSRVAGMVDAILGLIYEDGKEPSNG